MYEIPLHIQRSIRRYEPVVMDGLTLYPITVEYYEAFLQAVPAIDVMQRAFPPQYVNLPLLSAMFKMDAELVNAGQPPTGLFYRALSFLALALRLGEDADAMKRGELFQIAVDPAEPTKLRYVQAEGLPPITPIIFHRLRYVLAEQNGIRLTSDNANPDLVEAEREIAAQNAPELDIRMEDMVSAISLAAHIDEAEIYDWAIRRLLQTSRAYQRVLDYVVCGIAAASGSTWKDGNPVPHPLYDRKKTDSAALISMSSLPNGAAATNQ